VSEPASIELRLDERGTGPRCREILATLPTWFGIPESVDDYVRAADANPTVVASIAGEDVGILTLVIHTPYAAEVYVMGVRPEHHRRGVGAAMLAEAERWLAARDIEFLQVKTLSPRHSDPGYVKTRSFYVAQGFRPLEEFLELWGPDQPALQMVKTIPRG
jgi:GNAT superfamily N-acetyltransferase